MLENNTFQTHQNIIVLDYGGQYTQLICRRVREIQVYAHLVPWQEATNILAEYQPMGIILSGGPNSVYEPNAPRLPTELMEYAQSHSVPILGICYGLQLLVHTFGGQVIASSKREYGLATVQADSENPLFTQLPDRQAVWMSHGDRVERLPTGFQPIATSENSPFAAVADEARKMYGLQFHPEVVHTPNGAALLENFVKRICGCTGDWTAGSFIEETIQNIRTQVGPEGRVICGLSGGVDSAVAAALVEKAIGDRLTCIFVDHGLMRQGEFKQVIETFQDQSMQLIAVDASELSNLPVIARPAMPAPLRPIITLAAYRRICNSS